MEVRARLDVIRRGDVDEARGYGMLEVPPDAVVLPAGGLEAIARKPKDTREPFGSAR